MALRIELDPVDYLWVTICVQPQTLRVRDIQAWEAVWLYEISGIFLVYLGNYILSEAPIE